MLTTNYHMHSKYCDGYGEITDYTQEAIIRGMNSIGMSSHAPVPFKNTYTIKPSELASYVADVRHAQEQYRGQIEIALGAEIDVIPGLQEHYQTMVIPHGFDYFIGSVHHIGIDPVNGDPWEFDDGPEHFEAGWQEIYSGNFRKMAEEFYISEQLVPTFVEGVAIVGHMDRIKRFNYHHRYFHEEEQWYRDLVFATIDVYAKTDIIVELNTAGWRTPTGDAFPSDWVCQGCHDRGIRMTINTDAHRPEHMGADHFRAIERLQHAGYREIWVRRHGQWVPEPLPAIL